MALLFVFGIPGAGKSFVGRILHHEYQFFHYEADEDLTPAMIEAIQHERVFTDVMRHDYFDLVIQKTQALCAHNKNVVVTQALIKETNRQQISLSLPEAQFIHVTAAISNINERLKIRNNWVSIEYANKIRAIFEPPTMPHIIIDNNRDRQHIINQLDAFLTTGS